MQEKVVQKIKDPRKLATELIFVCLVMVGLLLAWNATARIKNFNDNQLQLAEHSVKAAASEAVLSNGGTITHHHAVGRDHRPWYDRQRPDLFGRALDAAKRELDPAHILNPGTVLD